jgi:hypothetical protein
MRLVQADFENEFYFGDKLSVPQQKSTGIVVDNTETNLESIIFG